MKQFAVLIEPLIGKNAHLPHNFSLLGPPVDHGLMVNSVELTRRSRPVISLQQLCNWIHRESRPNAEEELSELRSEVPKRWLAELRAIVGQEAESAA